MSSGLIKKRKLLIEESEHELPEWHELNRKQKKPRYSLPSQIFNSSKTTQSERNSEELDETLVNKINDKLSLCASFLKRSFYKHNTRPIFKEEQIKYLIIGFKIFKNKWKSIFNAYKSKFKDFHEYDIKWQYKKLENFSEFKDLFELIKI